VGAETAFSPAEDFRRYLRERVSPVIWQTWVEPLMVTGDAGEVLVAAPTEFHIRWVRERHREAIEAAAHFAFGPQATVRYDSAPGDTGPLLDAEPAPESGTEASARSTLLPARPTAKYTFDTFVVGPSNRFAHAAAMAVAEQPGHHYNPLFIYASAGLGKTHLLHAVGQHGRELHASMVARYVTSEQFFNDFIDGIRRKRMDEFKHRYRTIDILLLDDVQFFEGKEQILEEFFHTFNTLHQAGKQLVITSDRHPKHLSTLPERLRSRFEWGLLTDIQAPDVETRLAILRRNSEFASVPLPEAVLEFIATRVLDNVRELEGALTRVTAYAALTQRPLTAELAAELLHDLIRERKERPLTAQEIIETTAAACSVSVAELVGPSRRQRLVRARHIAMYISRELTDLSLPKIGAAFGGRDHTTVLHALDKIRELMLTDQEIFDQVTAVSQTLRTT